MRSYLSRLSLPRTSGTERARRTTSTGLLAAVLVSGFLLVAPAPSAHAAPLNDCVVSDNGDPVLTSFTRTPAVVDVTKGRKRVFFSLEVEDLGGPGPASGVGMVWVGFGGAPSMEDDFEVDPMPRAELAQNAAGTWVGSVVVPRWMRSGRVRLGVLMEDNAENHRSMRPADLSDAGFPNQVMVTSTPDTTAPELTALRITPKQVDTRTRPQALTFTATTRDTQSHVRWIRVQGNFDTADHPFTSDPDGAINLTRVAGTVRRFRGATRVPRYVGSGTWKLYGAEMGDRAGNYKRYGYRRLGELGFDRDLAVVSRVDDRKPELRRFALTPGSVDVRTAGQTVTITLRVRDLQSGVQAVQAWFWSGGTGHGSRLHLVAGTRRDGTWQGRFTVHRCTARAGGLRTEVWIRDRSGKTRNYGSRALADAGWRNKIAVTAADHTVPSATINRSVPRTRPLKVTFSQGVNGITSDSAVVRMLLEDRSGESEGPVLPGAWTCRTGLRAPTDCETGTVRTARFYPTDPLDPSKIYQVMLNPEFSLAVTDLAGNPFRREQLIVWSDF